MVLNDKRLIDKNRSPLKMAGGGQAQNVHFRTACDPCSAAKVRCDKKHPACDRCVQFKLQCSYSHSRRHGRRSLRKKLAWEKMKIASTAIGDPALVNPPTLIAPAGTLPGPTGWNLSVPSPPAPFIGSQDSRPPWDCGEAEIDDTSTLFPSWPFGAGSGPGIDVDSFARWDMPDLSPPSPRLHSPEPPEPPETAHGDTARSAPIPIERQYTTPITISTHDCEAQAISILHSMQHGEMQEGATSCSTNPVRYAELNLRPSFDRVLATNKAALNGCARLMKCSCALCPHIILLHVSILSKVLFWYRIAATDKTSPSQNTESGTGDQENTARTTSQSPEEPPTPDQFSVSPTGIQIGVLSLDAGDESELRRVILLQELRRTENVIDELMNVDRTALDENGDDVVRSSVQWSLGGISRVREELRNVMEKIIRAR
ncbi:hypothetical protein EKO27_g9557 [Xylaria grammica]|uniref:Zn(2)-C6 fungal-type domain-containing protein n=1 Tax=Xylaria grammica TaxID=363999 RepID=A0A439CTR2_9PEZI|nr:hypothetical protein EKO27_g9557 [Xylaria grammica]